MTIQLLTGDARDVLPTLPADSVHTVVTSPPYYALRSYLDASHPDKHREIGSEATPEAYLATMVQVFREIRRVLRPDGTCWVNIGDSYAGSHETGRRDAQQEREIGGRAVGSKAKDIVQRSVSFGAKPKDLLLMQARLALALQADGWWVRSDIIWHKPNPMPESCTDRPTSAHEHVFLLTKSARYFYDADAVREPQSEGTFDRQKNDCDPTPKQTTAGQGIKNNTSFNAARPNRFLPNGRNLRNVWTLATHAFPEAHFATYPPELVERCIKAGTSERGCCAACGKPWVRQTASTLYSSTYGDSRRADVPGSNDVKGNADQFGTRAFAERMRKETTTTGWSPGCKCEVRCQRMGCRSSGDAPVLVYGVCPKCKVEQGFVPCTVLDPFVGSGTTALVADRLQRHAIGIDLSLTYAEMAQRRIEMDCPLFTSWAPAEPPEDERMADLFAGDEYQRPPKALTTPRHDGNRWNENNGRGFKPRNGMPEAAE